MPVNPKENERLAAALRENLKKRKEQGRARENTAEAGDNPKNSEKNSESQT